MSSTTERPDRGQALALFAISLTVILLAGALAFDVGFALVDRRDQQNAADAAALAGARYLTNHSTDARSKARTAAFRVATANGFSDGSDSTSVVAHTPPISGPHAGSPGYIEVQIGSTRPSFFAGLAGIADWDTGARAVALNGDGANGDWALLSLNPEDCDAIKVTGTGAIVASGDIQVDSGCTSGALRASGGGMVVVNDGYQCNVHGDPPNSILPDEFDGAISCVYNMGADQVGDPLAGVDPPDRPALARPPELVGDPDASPPSGCPGADKKPSSWDKPQLCVWKDPGAASETWVLHPGLYPGGLSLQYATFHLMPGVYYIAGGGLEAKNHPSVLTVDEYGQLGSLGAAMPGVMFYNTGHPSAKWVPITLNGGGSAFEILPPDGGPYEGILIFNDRAYPGTGKERATSITLNGGGADFTARGTIYSRYGLIAVNGNSDEYELTIDQAIAYDFELNGNGGSIEALVNKDLIFGLRAAGLVE